MKYGHVVKSAFRHRYGHGGWVDVPAGARLQRHPFEADTYWVDPSTYPHGSMDRHDADHYGIRVMESNALARHDTEEA